MWFVNQNVLALVHKPHFFTNHRRPAQDDCERDRTCAVYCLHNSFSKRIRLVAFADSTGSVGWKNPRQYNQPDVDEALLQRFRFQGQSQPDLLIAEATLQVKAAMIREKRGMNNGEEKFQPSLGSVGRFKGRNNICLKVSLQGGEKN